MRAKQFCVLTTTESPVAKAAVRSKAVVVLLCFVFNVPPTAKVIWRRGHSLKSHPADW